MSNNEIILNHEKRIIELENVFDKFKHHEEVSKYFLKENFMMHIHYC